MRAIHICILLFGVFLSSGAQELNTTGDSIIDRLVSINATESEKKTVFIQLKALISVAPTTIFKNDVDGVIKEGSLFQIADDIGGVPGLKAVDALMKTYKSSENKENFLDFLRNCWQFMNNQEIPEYSKWSFLEEVVKKMSEGYDMEGVRKLLIEKDLEVPDELLKALVEKSAAPTVTTTAPTTTTVTSTTTPTTTPTTTTDSFEEPSSTTMEVTRRSGSVLTPPGMRPPRNTAPIPTTTIDSFEEPSSMTMEVSTERTENPTVPDSRNHNEATTDGIETKMETEDKETTTATTEASKTPPAPDPYFLNVIKYFDDNPILNDVLKDLLWDVEHNQTSGSNFVQEAKTGLDFIRHTRDDGEVRSGNAQVMPISMFYYFSVCFHNFDNFDQLFESLAKFRNFDFGPLVKIIKEFNELDDGQIFFVTKLESVAKQQRSEPVSTRAYVFFNAYSQLRRTTEYVEEIAREFIPALQEKSYRGVEILADALRKYRKFDENTKNMATWLTGYTIYNYECLEIWKNKNSSSEQMQELIELLELMDYELGSRSCFWSIKIRTIAPSPIITEFSLSTDKISTENLNSTIAEINDYLNETPLLKYEVLVDILERAEAQDFLYLAKNALTERPPNFKQFGKYFRYTSQQFVWYFELLVEFKEFDFKIVSILIEKIKKLDSSQIDDLIKTAKHYQDGPKYLTFSTFIHRVWLLKEPISHLHEMQNTLIPLLGNTTATTIQALSNSLTIWRTLDKETEKMAEEMRSEIDYEGCLKIWKRKNESDQMRNMLNMMKLLDVHLDGNSCLWKTKIVTPATIELDKYFDNYPILTDGLLGIFKYRKYYLQKYGEDFFTSAKSFFANVPISRYYVNFGWTSPFFVHCDTYFSHFPEFDRFIDSLTGFRDIDLTPLVKIMKEINALNHDEKKAFIEKLERGSPFLRFFEGYSNISPTTDYIERLKYDIIPHIWNMSPYRTNIMIDALKKWKVLGEGKNFFHRVLGANISDDECLDIWNKKNSSKEMLERVEMMELMDLELGAASCFWKIKIRSSNVLDLVKYLEPVLREGKLTKILEYAEKPEFIERIKNLLMAFHEIQNSQTLEETKNSKIMEYLDKYWELHDDTRSLAYIFDLRDFDVQTIEYLHDKFFEAQSGGYEQEFVDQFIEYKGIHDLLERIRSSKSNYWIIFFKDWLIPELQKSSRLSLRRLGEVIRLWFWNSDAKKDLVKKFISGNVDVLRECGLNIIEDASSVHVLLIDIRNLGFKSERIDYCYSYTRDLRRSQIVKNDNN